MKPIKIIIADDHELFRKGIKSALSEMSGISLIGEAINGKHLLDLLAKKRPDVVLCDITMPELDGIEAMKRIAAEYPTVKVIMMTLHDNEKFITSLIDLGANGYLLKDTEIKEVEKTIKKVHEEGYHFDSKVSEVILKADSPAQSKIRLKDGTWLTDRESSILKLICDGQKNSEIADVLCLSSRTVEGYRSKLIEKLGASNTIQMVRQALTEGLV